ncbi:hypothetical protein MRB53_030125 [Persea americana]|uniref:Uncharacterized protein n=1 Tax=Persea americana TaxID=3435 RepID=A0ACC2KKB1_PERAE|nr:hypothetical protein MRB53_030125 [Persea americana]
MSVVPPISLHIPLSLHESGTCTELPACHLMLLHAEGMSFTNITFVNERMRTQHLLQQLELLVTNLFGHKL